MSRTSKVERCQGTTKVLEVEVFIKDRKQLLFSSLLNVHHRNCASWLLSLKRVRRPSMDKIMFWEKLSSCFYR